MDLFNTLSRAFNPMSELTNSELTKQLRFNEVKVLENQEMAERTNSKAVREQALKAAEKYSLKLDALRVELEIRTK